MNPLLILLVGMAVIVGGILLLRLHAFLSLIAAALIVALLTPSGNIYRFSVQSAAVETAGQHGDRVVLRHKLPDRTALLVLRPAPTPTGYEPAGTLQTNGNFASAMPAGLPFQLHSGDLLLTPEAENAALESAHEGIGQRVAEGFGKTAQEIGVLIAMAAIVGRALMESGAAERIVTSCRRLLGDRHGALAFLISAFVLASLVLSDTTFYLLIPLAQVMRVRSGRDYTLYVLAIVAGATMTHSLVPPAAGPVFVATELHVDLLTMIVAGSAVGAVASASGYLYALWANRKWDIPLRAALGASQQELVESANRDEASLPPLWLSLTPILLPVVLIGGAAVAKSDASSAHWASLLQTVGDKNVALTLAAAVGLLMVSRRNTKSVVAEGVASAAVMILIISAGGAFGYTLRQTDIASVVKDMLPVSRLALIPLSFLVASAIRTAQGSAIVAMITAVGIVSPIAAAGSLGFSPVYLALAIGCGSKPIAWMNDAGFWIIGKTSGFTEAETLKTATVLMAIMGVVGLLATMVAAWLLPMV